VISLSTPSLGITIWVKPTLIGLRRAAFNSLSRDHYADDWTKLTIREKNFQLPLSGSLLTYWYAKQGEDNTLSTPSLGITDRYEPSSSG